MKILVTLLIIITIFYIIFHTLKYVFRHTTKTTKYYFKNNQKIVDIPQIVTTQFTEYKKLYPSAKITEFRSFNPSVFSYNNKFYYTLRVTNANYCANKNRIQNYVLNHQVTISFVVILSSEGNIIEIYAPELFNELQGDCYSIGFEDARPIVFNDKLYLVTSKRNESHQCTPKMHLIEISLKDYDLDTVKVIDKYRVIPLESPFNDSKPEKNWMPFVYSANTTIDNTQNSTGSSLCFVYSVKPHKIIQCGIVDDISGNTGSDINIGNDNGGNKTDGGKCIAHWSTDSDIVPRGLRGSSQVIKIKLPVGYTDPTFGALEYAYMCLVHKRSISVITIYGMYTSNFVLFKSTPPFNIIKVGPEFTFDTLVDEKYSQIEFTSGLAIDANENLYITYGLNDCHAKLCIVPLSVVMSSMF